MTEFEKLLLDALMQKEGYDDTTIQTIIRLWDDPERVWRETGHPVHMWENKLKRVMRRLAEIGDEYDGA